MDWTEKPTARSAKFALSLLHYCSISYCTGDDLMMLYITTDCGLASLEPHLARSEVFRIYLISNRKFFSFLHFQNPLIVMTVSQMSLQLDLKSSVNSSWSLGQTRFCNRWTMHTSKPPHCNKYLPGVQSFAVYGYPIAFQWRSGTVEVLYFEEAVVIEVIATRTACIYEWSVMQGGRRGST